MKWIAIALGLVAASPLSAQERALEYKQYCAAAEARIEHAIANADRIVVEAVVSTSERRPVWSSVVRGDIQVLAHSFRLLPPRIEKRIVDGKEVMSIVRLVCGCHGQLWVTLCEGDRVLLSALIFHGSRVNAEALGDFEVDHDALAPFYDRMMKLAREKANQPPEPMRMSVTTCADAQLAPATRMAHR